MWFEVQLENIPQENVEIISERLEEAGALSITLSDSRNSPIFEPSLGSAPLWPEVHLKALFNSLEAATLAKNQINSQFSKYPSSVIEVADQVWERVCHAHFKPQSFGENLWICPSWCEPVNPKATNIMIDPGLAFGTGSHATTALCLEWLAKHPPKKQTVLDFGCGSGILAISAAKLGAQKVYALDIDPQALQATEENARQNNCDQTVQCLPPSDSLAEPCDLIIANILLEPLQSLKTTFATLLNKAGTLIVSGILNEQIDNIIDAYQGTFQCVKPIRREEWALVVFTHALLEESGQPNL